MDKKKGSNCRCNCYGIKTLILDEPTAGLDQGKRWYIKSNKILHDEYKMTIIIVSHSMEDVANIAEKSNFMNKGLPFKENLQKYL